MVELNFAIDSNHPVILTGPTGIGKTDLAISLASKLPFEIVNVDTGLFYEYLNIGTAKPSHAILNSVPHHLINIITPVNNYSVAKFIEDYQLTATEIFTRGKVPLIVGGTMMYINALINGISRLPDDATIRLNLNKLLAIHGIEYLYKMLCEVDIECATQISPNNKYRIMRALEIYMLTQNSLSNNCSNNIKLDTEFTVLALVPADRAKLYDRVDVRFDNMIAQGLINEVQNLMLLYPELNDTHNATRLVGYKQIWHYLHNECTYQEAIINAKLSTRHLIKRQLTWLRHIKINNIMFYPIS